MPKEKTFWVNKDESGWYFISATKDGLESILTRTIICPSEGQKVFGKMKLGELKQFKIVEVKRERP